jgi:hypothetical protein
VQTSGTLLNGQYTFSIFTDTHLEPEPATEPSSNATATGTLLLGDLAGGAAVACSF